jgi:penicillin-binding protein 2
MRRDKQEAQAQFTRRSLLLSGLGAGAFAALSARMYGLQVLEQDAYRLLSEQNQFNFRLQPPARGRLLDRFGEAIAENRESYRLMIVRDQAGDPRAALERLSRYMPISETRIERILRAVSRTSRFTPVTVAEDLDWETFARINLHLPDLPGITPDVGEVRTYPRPYDFAHVTGYVQAAPPEAANDDPLLLHPGFRIGRTGAELQHEDRLRGSAGQLKVEVNATGRVMREIPEQSIPSIPGQDVTLTLDARAQRTAMEALGDQSASAVGLDVVTGEILVLASTPSFDPNAFVLGIGTEAFASLNNNPYRPLFNKATTGLYAPASTVKLISALAALEHGLVDPEETVYCAGHTRLGNRDFHCWRRQGHGRMNLHEAVKQSCDVYFYDIANRLGIERYREMMLSCGLGEYFDIELPFPRRAEGLVPSPAWKRARRNEPWTTGDTYNVGIGQGALLASPLQLAVMTARIATGRQVTPTLTRQTGAAPNFASMGWSAEHLALVQHSMSGVVNEPGGSAYWPLGTRGLDLDGLEMAGKTGTSQVYSITTEERAAGVRDQDDLPWRLRNHGLFVSYAPVSAPRYVVSVVIEHGGGGTRAAIPAQAILRDLVRRDPSNARPDMLASAARPTTEG